MPIYFQETHDDKSPNAPLSTASEIQQLRDQLDQQALQTREALFQLMQVREQLISETNLRIEAQVRIDIGFIHSRLFVFILLESNQITVCHSFSSLLVAPYAPSCLGVVQSVGKDAAITTAESGTIGAFGFFGRLHVHGKRTGWPNIGKHQLGTTGIIAAGVATAHEL